MEKLIICFSIFYLGSFLGCIIEEIWCLITRQRFEIRKSMVYEPLIPIYGFSALLIVLIADKVGYNLLKVFFIGAITASIVEYFSSYFQEKIFHTKSWDYSKFFLNLHGRINLLYSIGFGLCSVAFIKNLKKLALFIVYNCNINLLFTIATVLLVIFMFDMIISFLATYRQKKRREKGKPKTKLDKFLDKRYPDERLDRIYSNSVYIKDKK